MGGRDCEKTMDTLDFSVYVEGNNPESTEKCRFLSTLVLCIFTHSLGTVWTMMDDGCVVEGTIVALVRCDAWISTFVTCL